GGGWIFQTAPTRPAGQGAKMVYDVALGASVAFGGEIFLNPVDQTAGWDGSGWSVLASSGPQGRVGHALAYDLDRGLIVLFGGEQSKLFGNGPVFNDTWEWDGTTWMPRSPSPSPAARQGHALAYDEARRRTVLFGGDDGASFPVGTPTYFGDTWEWD